MAKFIKGLGSIVAIAALLVGIPAALIFLAGNPIPSAAELMRALTGPDFGGEFLIGTLLPIIAWVAWATFAIGFLVELPAQIRRVPAPRLPGLGFQQKGAAVLLGAVIVMFTGLGALAPTTSATAIELPDTARGTAISQSFTAHEGPAVSDVEAVQATAAPAPTYTVQDGESLWSIAEKTLGSGERWGEIAQLNYGVEQSDGWALTAENWLNQGWVLTLPAEAAAATAGTEVASETVIQVTETERTVVSGDTLWGIADEELGDGARYPEIFAASQDQEQPGGVQITDPNLIYPGQVVDIPVAVAVPATATASVSVAPVVEPSGTADVATANSAAADESSEALGAAAATDAAAQDGDLSGLGIAAPGAVDSAEEAPSESAPTVVDDVDVTETDWIDEIFNTRTAGGIGAIAAAGLLSVLAWRRLKQRRNRPAGKRISMPSGEASTMELELRAVENPIGMEDVDHALRHLAVWAQDTGADLPPVYAIRLAETEIAIFLDAPADLPEPFVPDTDDHQAWTVDPAQLPPLSRVPSAPYPALVTIGQDKGNAHVLVDLEHIGALNLSGDPAAISGALTALTVELATSQWAEDLQITLVGIAPGLPRAIDTGRVRHVDDVDALIRNLRGQAQATRKALDDLGVDSIEEARSLSADAEAWIPEIVILGELPDEKAQAELAELVTQLPRVGIASITAGHLVGDWTLHLVNGHEAELRIPAADATLPLTPQIVNELEYSKILELFDTTETEAVEGPSWSTHIDREEISIDEIEPATETVIDQTIANEVPDADDEESWKGILHSLLPAGAGIIPAAPLVDEAEVDAAAIGTPAPGEFSGNPIVQLHSAPHIQVLGTVAIHGARGEEPRTPKTSEVNRSAVARATELVSFLVLHPSSNAVEVHDALWPGRDPSGKLAQQNRNALTTKARKWLGNSETGEPFLPPVGTEGYRLHQDVRSDWDVWLQLIGDDVTKTPTTDLVTALKLVKGQPFSGVKEKYYVWAERLRQEMIAAIGDAAHELATRSLRSRDTANARLAAAVGRQIDPINELFWRDALRAEHQAGDQVGFDRVVTQLEEHLQSFDDGYEADPETQELIEAIREHHAIAS